MTTRISEDTRAAIKTAWPEILSALAAGELVRDVLARLNLKPEWLRAYRASEPGARQEWEDAREDSAHAFMEEAMTTARAPTRIIIKEGKEDEQLLISRLDPAHARNLIDTLKWAARIRNPRLYSDKASIDVNVKTVDLTRIITDANARLAAAQVGRIIDGQVMRRALAAPVELSDLL
jgi:hypothetical protein